MNRFSRFGIFCFCCIAFVLNKSIYTIASYWKVAVVQLFHHGNAQTSNVLSPDINAHSRALSSLSCQKYSSYKYDPKQLQLRANDESGLPWESARTGFNYMNVSDTVLVYEAT